MKKLLKKLIPASAIHLFWHLPKAMLAAIIYGFPGKKLTIIAVAGTKGKTSTAYFISALLDRLEIKNALFSTAALKVAGVESMNALKLTTPTPFFLQKFLRDALRKGCTHAVIEVSSHAILQHRIWGITLPYVALTNLMPDHQEFHATPEEYRASHFRLLTPQLKILVANGDDPNLADFITFPVPKIIFKNTDDEAVAIAALPLKLKGAFNLSNLQCASAVIHALGIPFEKIFFILPLVTAAPGRTEEISEGQPFSVIVDYAHSVDSLTAFFQSLSSRTGKIITVFGACGERDPRPRPEMGRVLDTQCDEIVITNDDPYSENPDAIANAVLSGVTQKTLNRNLWKILDRRAAIAHALSRAREGDIVCILGKGAEQWQVFDGKKIPWDDRRIVREELAKINRAQK